MERMVKNINTYSGALTFVSFLAAVLFYFFGLNGGIEGLKADHVRGEKFQEESIKALTSIHESLKDKERDHAYFSERLKENTRVTDEMSKTLLKINVTLENLDKTLDDFKRNNSGR